MKTTIRITLDVEVEPFTREELEACGFEGEEADPLPVEIQDAETVAEAIASHVSHEEYANEILSGSSCFVGIKAAKVVSADLPKGGAA